MTSDTSRFSARAIDARLVRRPIAVQFPRWADLAIRPAEPQGHDNRTFRLGEALAVRLPSGPHYAAQIEKEQAWLPRLAPHLPLPIPAPIAVGAPGEGYPFAWSVNRWLAGDTARPGAIVDPVEFATDVAAFLRALQLIDATGGPPPGPHCFWRGGALATYDDETRQAIATLGDVIDGDAATAVWEAALVAEWRGPDVWFQGDVAANNLLVGPDGRLCAVIDFGCAGVGDPACDLVLAWTLLDSDAREAFRDAIDLDAGTWARARGWALWKALILLASPRSHPDRADSPRIIDAVLAEHRAGG